MSTAHRTDANSAYRAIVERLLRERSDVTPSDIVEQLGDYVIWGPLDPQAAPLPSVAPEVSDSAFAAA